MVPYKPSTKGRYDNSLVEKCREKVTYDDG